MGRLNLFYQFIEFFLCQWSGQPHNSHQLNQSCGFITGVANDVAADFPQIEFLVILCVLQVVFDFVIGIAHTQKPVYQGYIIHHQEYGFQSFLDEFAHGLESSDF